MALSTRARAAAHASAQRTGVTRRAGRQSAPPHAIPRAAKRDANLRIAGMDAYEYCDLIRSL